MWADVGMLSYLEGKNSRGLSGLVEAWIGTMCQ